MKLLLKLMFVGAGYAGFQAQNDDASPKPSIQRTLTAAFSEGFGRPMRVTGCSRTDAGVHATGFCAAVEPYDLGSSGCADSPEEWLKIPVGKVHRAMNRYLPSDISIAGEAAADDDFHPRYSAVGKTYVYRMTDAPWKDPFLTGFAWQLPKPMTEDGLDRMRRAAAYIPGKRDFTSFMAAGSKIRDARRTVKCLTVERDGAHSILLTVSADGFLYHMVRIIAGTLADCAAGTMDPDSLPAVIGAKDRSKAGRTAPAHGLYLADVDYGRPIGWKCD